MLKNLQQTKLAYSILDNEGNATYPKIITHERCHFSFPYIFENDGEIYIMPETCGRNVAQLYRATQFPNKWVKDKILIQNEFVVDSVFLDDSNMNQILGSVQYRNPPEGRVISCWVKNVLFENNIDGVSQHLLYEGEYGIRNAGKIFFDKQGNRIRPGQDCSGGVYGKGLVFWKMDEDFKETDIYHIDAEAMQCHIRFMCEKMLVGTHTYNASEHYEVIDFSYYAEIPRSTLLLRAIYSVNIAILRRIKKPLKKVIGYFCNKNTKY